MFQLVEEEKKEEYSDDEEESSSESEEESPEEKMGKDHFPESLTHLGTHPVIPNTTAHFCFSRRHTVKARI